MPTLASIHRYPIKSCRGHTVAAATLDRLGLIGDRRFLVVDERGHFLTQRAVPQLARIEPVVHDHTLILAAPGAPTIEFPTQPATEAPDIDVVVWRDTVRATDLGATAANWFSELLGRPARLVATAPEFSRPICKPTARPGDEAAFADAYPLLIISQASIEDLNDRLDEALPMDRFRPNLVITGCPAYAEDQWRRIRIGDVVLRAAGPCGRCVVTTTDQLTLERGKEPLFTLAQYRRSAEGEVNFGQNYIHETKFGELRLGAPIEVLE